MAVETIRLNQGNVFYDYMMGESGLVTDPRPPGPEWLRNLIGVDYFAAVDTVICFAPDDQSATALAYLPGLRGLGLRCGRVSDRGLLVLKDMSQLRWLQLWHVSASDAGWEPLGGLTSLEGLCLTGDHLGGAALGQLKCLRHLKHLTIGGPEITDAQCEILGRLATIDDLCLLNCGQVTDAGLQHLRGLPHLLKLEVLGRTRISVEGMDELQRALPNLKHILLDRSWSDEPIL